jgi:adenylate kinase family enzyme
VYHRQTAPLVEYYGSRREFRRVDGDQLVDDVTYAIVRAITEVQD